MIIGFAGKEFTELQAGLTPVLHALLAAPDCHKYFQTGAKSIACPAACIVVISAVVIRNAFRIAGNIFHISFRSSNKRAGCRAIAGYRP